MVYGFVWLFGGWFIGGLLNLCLLGGVGVLCCIILIVDCGCFGIWFCGIVVCLNFMSVFLIGCISFGWNIGFVFKELGIGCVYVFSIFFIFFLILGFVIV